jgi:hypothetical protein
MKRVAELKPLLPVLAAVPISGFVCGLLLHSVAG